MSIDRKVTLSGNVKVTRKTYDYDSLGPNDRDYVNHTMRYLNLESTPARRDNLARMMFNGSWGDALNELKRAIDSGGVELNGK